MGYRRGTRGWGYLSRRLPALLRDGARQAGRYLLAFAFGVSLILLIGVGLGPHTGGYRTLTVLSGSMHPAFDTGDVVVATPERLEDVRVGQVIVYTEPVAGHATVSHRVVWVEHDSTGVLVRTRGDANPADDPWTARLTDPTVWRVRFPVPRLGYLLEWLRTLPWRALVVYVVAAAAVLWLARIWRPRRRAQPAAADQPLHRVTSTARTGPSGGRSRYWS